MGSTQVNNEHGSRVAKDATLHTEGARYRALA